MAENPKRIWYLVSLVAALVLASGGPLATARAAPQTLDVSRIKPGMTGYGLTVLSGFQVERFSVRVIDVMRNFLPRQDLILIEADHPRLRQTGVLGGMSGSPIFLEGKLVGALAYGWRFSKEPIAGVTPIASMTELLQRPLRGPEKAGFASVVPRPEERERGLAAGEEEGSPGEVGRARRFGRGLASVAERAWRRGTRWWRLPFPAPGRVSPASLVPVAVPLNAAGFGSEAMALLKDAFSSYGFEPVQGGGTGRAEGPAHYENGGSLGVQLVAGDMSLVGTGTATWVEGKRVLGFGHRLFNAGEIYLPAVTARVNHSLASLARSFKIASPARVIGALVQDRQPGVVIDTWRTVGTVPMTVSLRYQGQQRVFKTTLAHHRLLTATLANTVLTAALNEGLADVAHATMKMTTRFTVKKYPTVTIEDHLYASSGARLIAVLFSRGLRELRRVMDNPFEPAYIGNVDVEMEVKFANEAVEIAGVSLPASSVEPGSRVNLTVSFKPFAAPEFTKVYPLEIPRALAGSLLLVDVASGDSVRPDVAPPQNMGQMLRVIQEGYPARSVVISLMVPTEGLKIRGDVIRDLPISVIDALNTGSQVRSDESFQTAWRQVSGTSRLVSGRKSVRIRVRPETR